MISHFQGSAEYLDVDRLVTQLLDSNQLRDPKCSVYIQGHGAQHLFYYWFFGHSPDVELVWSGFSGPSFLAFVSLFIPGHAGLVKVKNLDKLTVHYDSLSSNSMSTLYVLPTQIEREFLAEFIRKPRTWPRTDFFTRKSGFVVLTIDHDFPSGKPDDKYVLCDFDDALDIHVAAILNELRSHCSQ